MEYARRQGNRQPIRLLLVEDNRDAAHCLKIYFEHFGFEVVLAHSGTAAVQIARRMTPDVILCDIGLPGLDGFQVAQALRASPQTSHVPMYAISAYGQEEYRRRAMEAGFNGYFIKPLRLPQILEQLGSTQRPARMSASPEQPLNLSRSRCS